MKTITSSVCDTAGNTMKKAKKFMSPRTIAVIGASSKEGKVGNIIMKKLFKFKGNSIPINPEHEEILGKKTYASIKDYPRRIDLAVIAVPEKIVREVLQECGEKNIKNVIIVSAGFSEIGNKQAEGEIIELAKKYKINLLGPNCFGIANPYLNLDVTFAETSSKPGSTAFISQSGALWSYISDIPELSFSGFASLGNMADLEFADFIEYFNRDKNTKKIILYIERLKDGKKFIKACRKSRKEILAVKAGKSSLGKQATISHTGSLATDFEIYKGAFKQARVKLADSIAEAFNLESHFPELIKGKTAIITNAGGAGALITDKLIEIGFDVNCPFDILGTATPEDYKNILNKLKKNYKNFIVVLTPQAMSSPEKTAEEIVKFAKSSKKNIIAFFLGEISIKKAKEILEKAKIPCYTKI